MAQEKVKKKSATFKKKIVTCKNETNLPICIWQSPSTILESVALKSSMNFISLFI